MIAAGGGGPAACRVRAWAEGEEEGERAGQRRARARPMEGRAACGRPALLCAFDSLPYLGLARLVGHGGAWQARARGRQCLCVCERTRLPGGRGEREKKESERKKNSPSPTPRLPTRASPFFFLSLPPRAMHHPLTPPHGRAPTLAPSEWGWPVDQVAQSAIVVALPLGLHVLADNDSQRGARPPRHKRRGRPQAHTHTLSPPHTHTHTVGAIDPRTRASSGPWRGARLAGLGERGGVREKREERGEKAPGQAGGRRPACHAPRHPACEARAMPCPRKRRAVLDTEAKNKKKWGDFGESNSGPLLR